MGLDRIPTVTQIHKWELFKLGSLGNRVVDDIHSHWESYLHKYGALADAPLFPVPSQRMGCSLYVGIFGETRAYTHQHLYSKKAAKPSLMVVVAPTTTEIGDNYFLNKLHKAACIKRKSVYFGPKVSGKRSHMQVVICPYCGVLSQNTPSGCSHIRRHLGVAFACGACRKF